ncbi:hypothetical protein D3C77_455200 [compost metagenome]
MIVNLPMGILNWVNRTSKDKPIIISGIIIGKYSSPPMPARSFRFSFLIDNAAIVPNMVDTTVDTTATIKLLLSASMTRRFWNSETYQSSVNPLQSAASLELLNE